MARGGGGGCCVCLHRLVLNFLTNCVVLRAIGYSRSAGSMEYSKITFFFYDRLHKSCKSENLIISHRSFTRLFERERVILWEEKVWKVINFFWGSHSSPYFLHGIPYPFNAMLTRRSWSHAHVLYAHSCDGLQNPPVAFVNIVFVADGW